MIKKIKKLISEIDWNLDPLTLSDFSNDKKDKFTWIDFICLVLVAIAITVWIGKLFLR